MSHAHILCTGSGSEDCERQLSLCMQRRGALMSQNRSGFVKLMSSSIHRHCAGCRLLEAALAADSDCWDHCMNCFLRHLSAPTVFEAFGKS